MHSSHSSFVAAAAQPFSPAAKGAKLPAGSPANTWATSSKLSLDGVFGTDGTAIIMFNPSPYADCKSIWYSATSSSNFTVADNTSSVLNWYSNAPVANLVKAGLAGAAFQNLPFNGNSALTNPGSSPNLFNNSSNFSSWTPPQVRSRVVSAGLSVTFSGTTLNDGGVFYALVDPSHENMAGQSVQSYLSQFTSVKWQRLNKRSKIDLTVVPVTREQQELSYTYDDCLFTQSPLSNQAGLGASGNASGSFVAMGPPALNVSNGATGFGQNFAAFSTAYFDAQQQLRNAVCLFWPLSRRNSIVINNVDSADGSTRISHSCTWSATGQVTWGGVQLEKLELLLNKYGEEPGFVKALLPLNGRF